MAFATPKELFQFIQMPFDLHMAAASFQQLVDTTPSPCEGFTLAYLDDIVMFSRTWEEHLRIIWQVFQHLHAAGLRVEPKKSKLGFKELEYLGYTVGRGQLQQTSQEPQLYATIYSPNRCPQHGPRCRLHSGHKHTPSSTSAASFNPQSRNIEREVLAVKWAVEALQFYLVNNPFTLLTDHAPLQ